MAAKIHLLRAIISTSSIASLMKEFLEMVAPMDLRIWFFFLLMVDQTFFSTLNTFHLRPPTFILVATT
ncbi:hypothetical protein IC575_001740 [Cucumis melo]